MKPLRQVLQDYKKQGKALPAFNIDSFEIYQAVELAVDQTNLPAIVQLSPSEDKFIEAERLLMLVKKAQIDGLPIYLNMDHGKIPPELSYLLSLGFDMAHFDGSSLSLEENTFAAKNLVAAIRSASPEKLIEVEFNKIELVDSHLSTDSFTDPVQAQEFMTTTGADLLAVSIGNLHGVSATTPEKLDLGLLDSISQSLPDNFLTLHGGSGIDNQEIQKAIKLGITKININTELRLEFRKSLQKQLDGNQSEKIYEYLAPVIADIKTLIVTRLNQFAQNI